MRSDLVAGDASNAFALPAGVAPRNIRVATASGEKLSALELLRRENELLRQTLDVANVPIDSVVEPSGVATATRTSETAPVKSSLKSDAGVGLSLLDATMLEGPQDYWSPCIEVPDNMEYVDDYGAISPIPDHDGTACFKWDNTMWSAAEHFKVSGCPHCKGKETMCLAHT